MSKLNTLNDKNSYYQKVPFYQQKAHMRFFAVCEGIFFACKISLD